MWRASLFVFLLTLSLTGATCAQKESGPPSESRSEVQASKPHRDASPGPSPQAVGAAEDIFLDLDVEPDYEGPPPLEVRFVLEVEDAVPPLKYEWDFGDGSPKSHAPNPTHVFEREGEYTTVVTVTDSRGVSASEDIDIYVEKEE